MLAHHMTLQFLKKRKYKLSCLPKYRSILILALRALINFAQIAK
jgi:hypothetical protein